MKILNGGYLELYDIQDLKDGEVAAIYNSKAREDWPNLLFYKYYGDPLGILGCVLWLPHKINEEYWGRINYTPVFWFENKEEENESNILRH